MNRRTANGRRVRVNDVTACALCSDPLGRDVVRAARCCAHTRTNELGVCDVRCARVRRFADGGHFARCAAAALLLLLCSLLSLWPLCCLCCAHGARRGGCDMGAALSGALWRGGGDGVRGA